jgi:hypothetical protein
MEVFKGLRIEKNSAKIDSNSNNSCAATGLNFHDIGGLKDFIITS